MSESVHWKPVHERTVAALIAWAKAFGDLDAAGDVVGESYGAIYRRVNKGIEWDLEDLVRAICHERAMAARSPLLEQLVADVSGAAPAPRPMEVESDARGEIGDLATAIVAINAFLGTGSPDWARATDLRLELDRVMNATAQLHRDLDAKLRERQQTSYVRTR